MMMLMDMVGINYYFLGNGDEYAYVFFCATAIENLAGTERGE